MATGIELHRADAKAAPFPAAWAQGDARVTALVQEPLPATAVTVARATFGPGAATAWHRHEGPQLLVFVDGPGFVETETRTPTESGTGPATGVGARATDRRDADRGDVVWCPAGDWHRHGAGPATAASHVSTTWGGTRWRA